MESVKEKLLETIENLSDSEAQKILEYARNIKEEDEKEKSLKQLSQNPAIQVPAKDKRSFKKVKPVPVKGMPASKLLIEDRR